MGKERDPRDVDVHEIVDVLERYYRLIKDQNLEAPPDLEAKMANMIRKLVGPERESESRWSTRHIVVDEAYCEKLADSLAVSVDECHDWFIGEPIKRVEKVATWALETADKNLAGLDASYQSVGLPHVHGQRGAWWQICSRIGLSQTTLASIAKGKSIDKQHRRT